MKTRLLSATLLSSISLMAVATPGQAQVFCGAGVITSFGFGVGAGTPTVDATNFYFKVDNSINQKAVTATMATVNGSSGWMTVAYTDTVRFQAIQDVTSRAYLAGTPVRVWNASGTNCGYMNNTTMQIQVCTASSDCASTSAPR